jgi:hypothetical protein
MMLAMWLCPAKRGENGLPCFRFSSMQMACFWFLRNLVSRSEADI